MLLFNVNSENFYGDLGQVKVAMRKDSTPEECERLRHLAQQVCIVNYKLDYWTTHNGIICIALI